MRKQESRRPQRLLQSGDVELDHAKHRLHGPLRARAVGTAQIFLAAPSARSAKTGRSDPSASLPATREQRSQSRSTLARSAQSILSETAWVYSKRMPPFSAMKRWAGQRELVDQHGTRLATWAVDAIPLHDFDFRVRQ